jgi:hypothetical protein
LEKIVEIHGLKIRASTTLKIILLQVSLQNPLSKLVPKYCIHKTTSPKIKVANPYDVLGKIEILN